MRLREGPKLKESWVFGVRRVIKAGLGKLPHIYLFLSLVVVSFFEKRYVICRRWYLSVLNYKLIQIKTILSVLVPGKLSMAITRTQLFVC